MIGSQGELSVAAVGICSQISSPFSLLLFRALAGGSLPFFLNIGARGIIRGLMKTFGISMTCMLAAVALIFAVTAITSPGFIGIYTDKQNIIQVGDSLTYDR